MKPTRMAIKRRILKIARANYVVDAIPVGIYPGYGHVDPKAWDDITEYVLSILQLGDEGRGGSGPL